MKFSHHQIFTQILLIAIVGCIFYNLFFLHGQLEIKKMAIIYKKNVLINDEKKINLQTKKIAYDSLKINPRFKISIQLTPVNLFRNKYKLILIITDLNSNKPLNFVQFYDYIKMNDLYKLLKNFMLTKYKEYCFEYFLIYRTKKSSYSTIKLPFNKFNEDVTVFELQF